ncbi:hypothetical protein D3C81_1523010 [compost metagenome]
MLGTFFGRQFVQGRRITGKPAQVQHVRRLDIVVQRTVVAPVGEAAGEFFRQFDLLGDLDHGVTLVGQAQGFVVDIAVHVPLRRQLITHFLATPDRPVVHGEHDLGIVAPHFQRFVEVFRPGQWVTDLRAAQGIGVVHRVGGVFGGIDRLLLLDVIEHFGRRFTTRRIQELVGQAIDDAGVAGFLDDVGRRDQRHCTG